MKRDSPLSSRLDVDALAMVATSAVLIGTGYSIWQQVPVDVHLLASIGSLACYVVGGALMLLSSARRLRRDAFALGGLLFAFLVYAAATISYATPHYGTDSLLFNAYAADLILHGIDPYTQSMQPAFAALGVPESIVTPTTDGHSVFALSYPALSVLYYVPALLLHVHNLLWISVFAHAVLIVALWAIAPRSLRALVPLVVFVDATYAMFTVGAVTDVLWVVPAALAAYFWRSRVVLAALFLGIACATKQTPWIVVPFALADWTRAAWTQRDRNLVIVPSAALLLAFVVPNAPFIAWHPQAWYAGIVTPFAGNLVMFGSGIAQLQTSTTISLDPHVLSNAAAIVLALALGCYIVAPTLLVTIPFTAPVVAYFVAPRSLHNYFMYWPILLTARLCGSEPVAVIIRARVPRWTFGALAGVVSATALAAIVALATAFGHSASVAIETLDTMGDRGVLGAISVRASSGRRDPRFVRFAIRQSGSKVELLFVSERIERLDFQAREFRLPIDSRVAGGLIPERAIAVLAVDAFSGEQFASRPMLLAFRAAALRNADLYEWSPAPRSLPIAWLVGDDIATSALYRVAASALRFDAVAPRDAPWRIVSIGQTIDASPGFLHVRLRPQSNYIGDAFPRSIFGVEIVDDRQNHTYYTIDSRLRVPRTYTRDRFTVNVLPGQLGTWNDVVVELERQPGRSPFLPKTAQVRFNIVAAINKAVTGAMVGDFGGISEDRRF